MAALDMVGTFSEIRKHWEQIANDPDTQAGFFDNLKTRTLPIAELEPEVVQAFREMGIITAGDRDVNYFTAWMEMVKTADTYSTADFKYGIGSLSNRVKRFFGKGGVADLKVQAGEAKWAREVNLRAGRLPLAEAVEEIAKRQ